MKTTVTVAVVLRQVSFSSFWKWVVLPKALKKWVTLPNYTNKNGQLAATKTVFRLDDLALSVIATASWLGGWLGGWLPVTAGIVSKRVNLS